MANSYTQFSDVLLVTTAKEVEWINQLCICLNALAQEDYSTGQHLTARGKRLTAIGRLARRIFLDFAGSTFEWEANSKDNEVWFYSEANGDPALVARVVQEFFKEHRATVTPPPVWGIQWCEFCDKPRVGEFGGGALLVTRTFVREMTTGKWLEDGMKALEKR